MDLGSTHSTMTTTIAVAAGIAVAYQCGVRRGRAIAGVRWPTCRARHRDLKEGQEQITAKVDALTAEFQRVRDEAMQLSQDHLQVVTGAYNVLASSNPSYGNEPNRPRLRVAGGATEE